jgi:hypothetical protein
MTSLKIVGVFGVVTVFMALIVLALPSSFTTGEELIEVNRTAKADRLSRKGDLQPLPCPSKTVGPMITYGPECK